MLTKDTPARNVKAGPEDGLKEGEFIVYPSTFIKKPDVYGDIVAAGAFEDDLKEWADSGNTMPGLYGHRMDDPDYFVASASEMGEDHHGWWVKGVFDLESPKGLQVYRLVKGRRLNQLSFSYDVIDQGMVELPDGTEANELRKLKVYEFSFVPVGANQDTSVVAVKSIIETVAKEVKAGRVLSSKNEEAIRAARDQALAIADALKTVLPDDAAGEEDQEQTSGKEPPPDAANEKSSQSDPATPSPSVLLALTEIQIVEGEF